MASPARLTCQELVALVTDYIEDQISARDRERFDAHLGRCAGCVIYVAQIRATILALAALPTGTATPLEWEELLTAYATWSVA